MFWKVTVFIAAVTALAAALLGLRHQRLEMVHQIAVTHRQIDLTRRHLWDLQVEVGQRVEPRSLQASIARAGLQLEPIVPVPTAPAKPNLRVAAGNHTRH